MNCSNSIVLVVTIGAALTWPSESAWAQSACPDFDQVSQEDRERARALKERAYQRHLELDYDGAAELYRQALALWPRPELYRQAGMAYVQATKLFLAYQHLSLALRCGADILGAGDQTEAQTVMKRLQPWFAEVEVDCRETDAQVFMDGESWFRCGQDSGPANRRVVLVGRHEVVARKPGHIAMTAPLVVTAGQRATVAIRLVPNDQATLEIRRWPAWQPWAVVGAGAAVGLVGVGFQSRATSTRTQYDTTLADLCQDEDGCSRTQQQESGLPALWDAAVRDSRIAAGAFVASGLVLTAGLAMLFLNQARERANPDAGRGQVDIRPVASRDSAGLSVALEF